MKKLHSPREAYFIAMSNGQHVYRKKQGIERLDLIDRLALTKTEVNDGVWVIARPEKGTGLTY